MTRTGIAASTLALLASLLAAGTHSVQADELEKLVVAKAGAVEVVHRKAERSLVGVAQDPSYRGYFAAHSHDGRSQLKDRIDRISLEAQHKFEVGEMCLIDQRGHEVSRIVEGEVAHDLSKEEAEAIFFDPGFALDQMEVYVSPVYMSPDVNRWVVAYVTPIAVDGENKAILHYEHDLAFFQQLLVEGLAEDDLVLLAINEEGWIIADSRRELPTALRGSSVEPQDYFERISDEGSGLGALAEAISASDSGLGTVILDQQPHRIAWQTVKRWTIVGLEREAL